MARVNAVMDMLDWNNGEDVQSQGITLARQMEDFSPFMRPVTQSYNKNVWDNCAVIVCSKTDAQLNPHAYRLLEWIQDLNWPGAWAVLDRLKCVQAGTGFLQAIDRAVAHCEKENDMIWKYVLSMLLENDFFARNLSERTIGKLKEYQKIDLDSDW